MFGRSKTRDERNLNTIQSALAEAWLRTHIGSRFVRFLMTIFIAVFVSVMVTDATIVESDRQGCERRQPIFRVIPAVLDDAVAQNSANPHNEFYKRQADIARKFIVNDCNKAYPHLYPMRWFVD